MSCIKVGILVLAFLTLGTLSGIVPTRQIMLYPNTQNSPSLYLISFRTGVALQANQYILVTMDWLSSNIQPYTCILVNSSISIRCTNLIPATKFTLGFTNVTLQNTNLQISLSKTIAIEVLNPLPANTDYFLEITLLNVVENLKKISPSMEIYTTDKTGLIHELNLNFGPVTYKPPITNILGVNVYSDIDDLANGQPGKLVTLKAQVRITIPVTTAQSSMFFILQHPFEFSSSSYVTLDQAQQYATNPIALNRRPTLSFYQVVSPHIFYIAFSQSFPANRKFIVMITEIKNPFFVASSNISIYTANFNSLTPLEAYQSIFPIKTVTQALTVTVGLPFDIPMTGPCVFYRNKDNYYQAKFYMPKDVPAGYAIKVLAFDNTVYEGTGYVNFESLTYTTTYDYYGGNYFIMRNMGPIMQGSLVSILFKASKSTLTNFYIDIYIDTEAVISAGTATSYMFYGRANLQSVDADQFFYDMYSGPQYQNGRIDTAMTTDHVRFYFCMRVTTSTGSYVEMYLSPQVTFDPNFDVSTDCRFFDTAGTAVCRVSKTANYVYIQVKPSTSYSSSTPNAFPQSPGGCNYIWISIYRLRFPRPSSPKYPYMSYFRLFNSSAANPTTYIQAQYVNVLPRSNTLTGITLSQHGNVNTSSVLNYPSFVRFQSKVLADWNYVLQQNQVKIISIYSSYGFRNIYAYANDDVYPCTSNIGVRCVFKRGVRAIGDWWMMQKFSELERIDIFFTNPGDQLIKKFHIILPDAINVPSGGNYYFFYQIGVYHKQTKDYKYYYRNQGVYRNPGWVGAGANNDGVTNVAFQGKAGSYRNNVTVTVVSSSVTSNYLSFVVISSSWMLFENTISAYTSATSVSTNPAFYSDQQCPLSVKLLSGMYLTVFPFKTTSTLATFSFYLNNLHMPYHYDLPNYYIYLISNGNNNMITSNQFQMTNQGIFYDAYLNSLTIQCLQNYLGVQNTRCTIVFGTQNPLKADGKIIVVFSGMNIATDQCALTLQDGTVVQETCYSTSDNKNVTVSMVDTNSVYHYSANNFTLVLNGISIMQSQISQSITLYLADSTGKYIIQKGTRILTTTVARPSSIQIYQITYRYLSPLSSNKMSIRFALPRTIYSDQRLGFIMGKDLNDVNSELERLRIVLTRADGVVLGFTSQLIANQYKVLFTFVDSTLLTPTSYLLEIYGIMTPVSHQNGAFSIIYQRRYDKGYTLTNDIKTSFPSFYSRISSSISLQSFFNTQGYQQKLVFTLLNTKNNVNSAMVWIVNFPSYYNMQLFNYNPYCMIDSTPIQCYADPTTRYQLIIKNSPKMISYGTSYTISVYRLTCPRSKYTHDYYRNYYLFIGVLADQNADVYVETALLYPEQSIQSMVNGIITISDVTVNTLTKPTFSSIYAIFNILCNVAIVSGYYLYIIFPYGFDNFNNNPINLIFKIGNSVAFVADAPVVDRTLQIRLTTAIAANTAFSIQFPSLPTPKTSQQIKMSQSIAYITPSNKLSLVAASSIGGNSAPILSFSADPRYISFNHDNTITITAGTYSTYLDISASDSGTFLTNIVVNLTSPGFTFQPASVFLKLGDSKATFRVGADSSLFPISYFYQAIKSQQIFTYYTITKNNNIRVTNNPVLVTIPSTISVPIGGCSTPFTIDILNNPITDVSISFNYDNMMYNQSVFWPNVYTTKSTLLFDANNKLGVVSFCVSSGFGALGLATSFKVRFVFAGTNYQSYAFTPNQNVTINVVPALVLPTTPSLALTLINRQKTFLQFNITPTVTGTVYHHFQIGQNLSPLGLTQIQVHIKNNQYTIQSMQDFMSYLYINQRDQRVGLNVRTTTTMYTLRISGLLPQRYYTMCMYLVTFNNVVSQVNCLSVQTQTWGTVMRAQLSYTSSLTADNLNKILCFFAKQPATQVIYAVDLQGNSCYNRAVDNLHFRYRGQTFSSQSLTSNIYLITNPYISSDPSPTAFQNMYNNMGQLSAASLSNALSGFAISFLSSSYQGSFNAIDMISRTNANNIQVSFSQPYFTFDSHTITVPDVMLSNYGTVYFVLVLYKQVLIDGNNSYVKIRLNADPTEQQILNCLNWENLPAEGCARAVYSYRLQTVTFSNIVQNCMYKLYYIAASQYPLRPIVSTKIESAAIVTFVYEKAIQVIWAFMVVIVVGMLG